MKTHYPARSLLVLVPWYGGEGEIDVRYVGVAAHDLDVVALGWEYRDGRPPKEGMTRYDYETMRPFLDWLVDRGHVLPVEWDLIHSGDVEEALRASGGEALRRSAVA